MFIIKSLYRQLLQRGCGVHCLCNHIFLQVRRENYRFLQEPEFREEGGTPAIVESVRAGLVFQLKNAVSPQTIMEKEEQLRRQSIITFSELCFPQRVYKHKFVFTGKFTGFVHNYTSMFFSSFLNVMRWTGAKQFPAHL